VLTVWAKSLQRWLSLWPAIVGFGGRETFQQIQKSGTITVRYRIKQSKADPATVVLRVGKLNPAIIRMSFWLNRRVLLSESIKYEVFAAHLP
jgi:hypothetical protein